MAEAREPEKAKLFVGMISGFPEVFSEAAAILQAEFGAVDMESDIFPFDCTDYYAKEMGENLKRKFITFAPLISQEELARIKIFTNSVEEKFAGRYSLARPINLDPGLAVASKIILASCKDFSHRIYLGRGVYAEVTLQSFKGTYKTLPWTYPDFRKDEYHSFFLGVRKKYLKQLAGALPEGTQS
jgi:hypothetical protein